MCVCVLLFPVYHIVADDTFFNINTIVRNHICRLLFQPKNKGNLFEPTKRETGYGTLNEATGAHAREPTSLFMDQLMGKQEHIIQEYTGCPFGIAVEDAL